MTPDSNDPINPIDSADPTIRSAADEPCASGQDERGGHLSSLSSSSAHGLLPIALSAAVPLWVYEIYQRGGPTVEDWAERLPDFGRLLAEHGDHLLHRSPRASETAQLFNTLAEALALLSFVPGGVPFGEQRFDALQILTGLLGEEQATAYVARVRRQALAEEGGL